MNRALFVSAFFSALFLTACPGGDNGDPYIGPGEFCSGEGLICSSDGEDLLKCVDGTLVLFEDCAAANKECKEEDGAAVCTDKVEPTDNNPQPDDTTEGTNPDDATEGTGDPDDTAEGETPDVDTAACGCDDLNGDEDGDGISNGTEGCGDRDMDGMANCLDADSDGDNIGDTLECPSEPCRNSDQDTTPDFLDKDSDNDGLADIEEVGLGTDPYDKDSDGDNSDDLAEIVYGSDPTDPNSTIPAGLFFVVLPYNAPEDVTRNLMFSTDFSTVDIAVLLDMSGSMDQEMANLKEEIKTKIIQGIPEKVPGLDVATGFAHFMDMENGKMFVVDHMVTTNGDDVQTAVNGLPETYGGVEPHQEVLYQAATGEGLTGSFSSAAGFMPVSLTIPKADCTGQLGTVGGLCFRELALKIFIMITDEWFPNIDVTGSGNCGIGGSASDGCWDAAGGGATTDDAINAMNGINAKFIGIDSSFDSCSNADPNPPYNCLDNPPPDPNDMAKPDFETVAEGTASIDGNGNYFLYHTESYNGSGMSDQIAEAVKELTTYIEKDISTAAESDEECGGINAAAFIASSKPDKADPVDGFASKDDTTFYKVKPSTEVYFDIHFRNDFCKNASPDPVIYKARIRVLGEGAFLSSREVQIIVPGSQAE